MGFSLGLTGGGGSIFAVPLLVYGLKVSPQEAVGVSLAAVGTTSLAGFAHRLRGGEVEVSTGLLFAVAGMVSAPLGHLAGRSDSGASAVADVLGPDAVCGSPDVEVGDQAASGRLGRAGGSGSRDE